MKKSAVAGVVIKVEKGEDASLLSTACEKIEPYPAQLAMAVAANSSAKNRIRTKKPRRTPVSVSTMIMESRLLEVSPAARRTLSKTSGVMASDTAIAAKSR